MPRPYSSMPAGSRLSSARPTLAYAAIGTSTAKASMTSSVLRRLGVPCGVMVVVARRRPGSVPLLFLLRSKVLT